MKVPIPGQSSTILAAFIAAAALTAVIADEGFKYTEHARYRRQFDASAAPQIDLNITVPYIFSARLYPYGTANGDETLDESASTGDAPRALRLQTPLYFLDKIYDTIYVRRDGALGLAAEGGTQAPAVLPLATPMIAVYWMRTRGGRVFFRETTDQNILNVAQNEVNIQYRYGNDFQTRSVVVVTWENAISERDSSSSADTGKTQAARGNVFQVALILGDNACFAHFIYSRLAPGVDAVAGFNGAPPSAEDSIDGAAALPAHFSLPGSGTPHTAQLFEKSNIGIPGEWLFRIDEESIHLCGAGFQGLECVDSCSPTQWYLDCSRQCHCADGNACNAETGECPDAKCSPGWEGAPICDTDVDECADTETSCPVEQPDCVNTPGAYLCLCFEYDNVTNTCRGGTRPSDGGNSGVAAETIPVPVMPLIPLLVSVGSTPKAAATDATARPLTPPVVPATATGNRNDDDLVFEVAPVGSDGQTDLESFAQGDHDATVPAISSPAQIRVSTMSPFTIRPILATKSFTKPATNVQFGAPSAVGNGANQTVNVRPLDETSRTVGVERGRAFNVASAPVEAPNDRCERCHQMAQCVHGDCVCVPGWVGNGEQCEDLDECKNPNACGLHAECQNMVGSYQCICDVGFIATANGCIDIDECADGLATCRGGNTSMCVNTMGGYECRCRAGFIGNPDDQNGCVDVNECENAAFHCGDKARCINTQGAFICECFEGYAPMATSKLLASRVNAAPVLATSMRPCVDVNECVQAPCHANATCTNLDGSFHCECADGFVGNGVECRETVMFPVGRNVTIIKDPTVPIKLSEPITVFSKSYSSIYVSQLGVLSFDQPLPGLIRSAPSELRTAALLPFHLAFNPQTSGAVTVKQFTGGPNRNDQLMKASLLVQSKFHVPDFLTTALYVFTYDQMYELNIEKPNTFQVLLIKGADDSTYAAFLYDTVESSPRGIAGVASTNGFSVVPTNTSPTATSNVGQRGKWLFRIDGAVLQRVVECPSGRRGAPFCEQDCEAGTWGFECINACHCADGHPCDSRNGFCNNSHCDSGFTGFSCSDDVDECAIGKHSCHANATCRNTHGSYVCKCNNDFRGDGFFCEAIDRCLVRFGVMCATNAHCDITAPDLPECVCDVGFHGDGRRDCAPDERDEVTTTTTIATTTARTTSTATRSSSLPTRKMTMQNGENSISLLVKENRVGDKRRPTHPSLAGTATSGNKDSETSEDQLFKNTISSKSESDASTDSSGMTLIYATILLCVIWAIAIVFCVLFCLYKRRRTRAEKYTPQMMGWSPREHTTTRGSYVSQFPHT